MVPVVMLLEAVRVGCLPLFKTIVVRTLSSQLYQYVHSDVVICGRGTRNGQCRSADGTGRDVAGS
jgi:hypothetical protein